MNYYEQCHRFYVNYNFIKVKLSFKFPTSLSVGHVHILGR